jgi:hypothetical protein
MSPFKYRYLRDAQIELKFFSLSVKLLINQC